MRDIGLGDDEEARRILVEAVDDARALYAADAGEFVPTMGDERVDERS